MDTSHTDFDNFGKRKLFKKIGKRLPGAKALIRRKARKLRTRENSDGSEDITGIENNEGEVQANPEMDGAMDAETSINSDGSENLLGLNQNYEEDSFGRKKRRRRKKPKAGISQDTPNQIPIDNKKLMKKRVRKPKSVGDEAIKFIKPLMKAMRIGLAEKGYNTTKMSQRSIIEKFFNEFVSRKNDPTSSYDILPDGFLENHYLFQADYDSFDSDNIGGISDIQGLVSIGKGLAGKFKGWRQKRKDKKAAQKAGIVTTNMNPTENKMAIEADKVVKSLEVQNDAVKSVTKEESKKSIVKYIIFAVVGLAILVLGFKLISKK